MENYTPATYGDRIADVYDSLYSQGNWGPAATDTVVTTLAELAQGGAALELGIGTGRVALPLAAKGIQVHGIDASRRMIDVLRSKPGSESIPVTVSDFADFHIDRRFSLVYVPFTTLFALPSQAAQISCFRSAAAHLLPGGHFVIEVFVPDLARFARGQNASVRKVETDQVELEYSRHDPVTQTVAAQHVFLTEKGIKLYPVNVRYAWPAELDLMAQLAGLRLKHRWSDWQKSPFTASSTFHVSVYEKP